jgi:transposase
MAKNLSINIQESATYLKQLFEQESDARKRERLQALYLLKSGKVTELKQLSAILGRNTSTLYRWFQQYKYQGLNRYLEINSPPGKPSLIPPEILDNIIENIENSEEFRSYTDIQAWVEKEYNLSVDYYVIYRAVRPYREVSSD